MNTDRKDLDLKQFMEQYGTPELQSIIKELINNLHDSLYEHYQFLEAVPSGKLDIYHELKLKDGKEYIVSCFWSFERVEQDEPVVFFDHYSPIQDGSINIYVDCNDEDDGSTFAIDISDGVDEWNYHYYNYQRGIEPKPIL